MKRKAQRADADDDAPQPSGRNRQAKAARGATGAVAAEAPQPLAQRHKEKVLILSTRGITFRCGPRPQAHPAAAMALLPGA